LVRIIGRIILRILLPYWGGGQWEQVKDVFILAAGDKYTQGQTGGEATHVLTLQEMPTHNHKGFYWSYVNEQGWQVDLNVGKIGYGLTWQGKGGSLTEGGGAGDPEKNLQTGTRGAGEAHNNMPPYRVAYCWKRVQ
jgi:microcystin-dependent protein